MTNKTLYLSVVSIMLFLSLLLVPFLNNRADAEPKRLTTVDQQAAMATKKQAKTDNMPDLQAFEDAIDKAFSDNKQATVLKKLARLLYVHIND
ncbi:MAG: hypothetical protein HQL02_03830 [Nitrospirae bacterium]|nr:hypothetical protein [Nitrospirota bacterium]